MKRLFIFFIMLVSISVHAQYLSQSGYNKLMNKSFGSLVTGQSTSNQVANYASFDPADGAFTFKGVLPLGSEERGRLSYLSLKVGGDLISESYSALFTNTALNTNSFVQLEWNVRLSKAGSLFYLSSDKVDITARRKMLDNELKVKFDGIDRDSGVSNETRDKLINDSRIFNETKIRLEREHDSLIQVLELDKFAGKTPNELKSHYNNLDSNKKSFTANELKRNEANAKVDSLNIILGDWFAHRSFERRAAEKKYKDKLNDLEIIAPITGLSFSWFTLIAATGKKKYYSFDGTKIFSEQLTKQELSTSRLGMSWNLYRWSKLFSTAFYINIGGIRVKDNNTSLLSTQEISQQRTIKNIGQDTTRVIVKKYNAYTDPITTVNKWSLFGNLYMLFGSRVVGLHFFPEYNIMDDGENITNIGIGIVASFINEKKDKPVINAEGYVNFLDTGNKLKMPGSFWKRNEIGIRFTLPFSLPTK